MSDKPRLRSDMVSPARTDHPDAAGELADVEAFASWIEREVGWFRPDAVDEVGGLLKALRSAAAAGDGRRVRRLRAEVCGTLVRLGMGMAERFEALRAQAREGT